MNADDSFSIITIRIITIRIITIRIRVRFWTRRRCTTTANLLICLLVSLCCSLSFSLISRTDRIKVFRPHFDRALDVFPFLLLLWRHDGLQKQSLRCLLRNLALEGSTETHEDNNVLDNTPNSRRKQLISLCKSSLTHSWKNEQSSVLFFKLAVLTFCFCAGKACLKYLC